MNAMKIDVRNALEVLGKGTPYEIYRRWHETRDRDLAIELDEWDEALLTVLQALQGFEVEECAQDGSCKLVPISDRHARLVTPWRKVVEP